MTNALFLLPTKSFHLNVVKKQTHRGTDTQLKEILCWFCVSNWRASHPLLVFVAYNMVSNYFSSSSLSGTHREKVGTELCQGNTIIKVISSLDFKFVTRWKKWCHCLKSSSDLLLNLPTRRRSRLSDRTPETPQQGTICQISKTPSWDVCCYYAVPSQQKHLRCKVKNYRLIQVAAEMTDTRQDFTNTHIAQQSEWSYIGS